MQKNQQTEKDKKIMSLRKLAKALGEKRGKDKTLVLVTGCFDILHSGHFKLFSFARKYCDVLIVGVEHDKTILNSKGEGRPVHNQRKRMEDLSEVGEVDFVFPIAFVTTFGEKNVASLYLPILKEIKPNFLATNISADKYWREKEKIIRNMGIRLLKQGKREPVSTTEILKNLKAPGSE